MAITLKTLLQVAPFPEEQRKTLLQNYDKLTEQSKKELSVAAWTALSGMYQARVKFGTMELLKEIQQNKRKYNKADFNAIKEKALHEILAKFDTEQTEDQIAQIRQQLASHQRIVGKADHTKHSA